MDSIIRPVITEKSMSEAQKGKYTFLVANQANKDGIKKAIEKMFNVHVLGVSTVVTKGKTMRVGTRRVEVKKQPTKKAVVTLKSGEKISLFEQATA